MDTLRFDHEDNDQINLGELEMALQSAVAAVFWRGRFILTHITALDYQPTSIRSVCSYSVRSAASFQWTRTKFSSAWGSLPLLCPGKSWF